MRISDWSSDVCSSDLTVPVVTPAHIAGNGSRHINHSRAHACSRYVFKDEVLDEQYMVWLQRVILIRSGRLSLLILAVDKGVGPPLRPFHATQDAVHHLRIAIGFWQMGGKVDRKSVVEGKLVAVRIYIGARRVIKIRTLIQKPISTTA